MPPLRRLDPQRRLCAKKIQRRDRAVPAADRAVNVVALLTYVAARLLLRTAERLGRALAQIRLAPLLELTATVPVEELFVRIAAASRTSRGPPQVVAA